MEESNTNIPPVFLEAAPPVEYPRMVERFKAIVLDTFVVLFAIVALSLAFSIFENAPGYMRGIALVVVIILYDPLFVSFFGGTLGHKMIGMMVKSNSDRNKNIFFPLAVLRSIIKWLLGWGSFITMLGDQHKRAIHDLASNSVVLYMKPEKR